MLIFPAEQLVFLCTPKCASSSVEDAYAPYAGSVLGGRPGLKHINYSTYEQTLKTIVQGRDNDPPPETVCLIRDPIEHLRSWFRYRQRPTQIDRSRSTRGWTFDAFIETFLRGNSTAPVGVSTQYEFVQNKAREIGVDRIFALENLSCFLEFMNERLDVRASLPTLNASQSGPAELSPELEASLRERLAPDLALHEAIVKDGGQWQNPNTSFDPQPKCGRGSTARAAFERSRRRMKFSAGGCSMLADLKDFLTRRLLAGNIDPPAGSPPAT